MADGQIDVKAVEQAIGDFKDPETGQNAMKTGQIRDIRVSGDGVSLTLALTTHSAPLHNDAQAALEEMLRSKLLQVSSVDVKLAVFDRPPRPLGQLGLTAKTVVAVGSGKGGVGKSTIAASLAYGLHRAGCRVGLMDADVYGPSIPKLTGVSGTQADIQGPNCLLPVDWNGIPVRSLGFLIGESHAVLWRGPMLHKLVNDFLGGTQWGNLDYLIVDMPPGTGDVALSLSQAQPGNTGAVVVCTPQEVALLDAAKAIDMLGKVNVPILGIVENMSGFVCPGCNKRYDIFGSGGARQRAEDLGIPFLGEVPINIQIRTRGDDGETATNFDDAAVAPYLERIAYQLSKHLSDQAALGTAQPQLPVLD